MCLLKNAEQRDRAMQLRNIWFIGSSDEQKRVSDFFDRLRKKTISSAFVPSFVVLETNQRILLSNNVACSLSGINESLQQTT